MIKKPKSTLFLITVLSFALSLSSAQAGDHAKLAQEMYSKHIFPGYIKLRDKTEALKQSAEKFCKLKKSEDFDRLLKVYAEAVVAWTSVEHIRFGPVTKKYRYERFSYWPDIRGRGLRQVRRVLDKEDQSVLNDALLSKKSIALQGLNALEYLLYSSGLQAFQAQTPKAKFRCDYSVAVANNLSKMARQVADEWKQDSEYVEAYLNPAKGKVFQTHNETTLALFQAYVTGYQRTRTLKILSPLGEFKQKRPNYKRSPYWRSGLTLKVISANMDALQHMYLKGGFAKHMSKGDIFLSKSVELSTANGMRILKSMDGLVVDIFADEKKLSKFRFIASILGVIRGQTGLAIIKAGNLTIGFNADDGD